MRHAIIIRCIFVLQQNSEELKIFWLWLEVEVSSFIGRTEEVRDSFPSTVAQVLQGSVA